MTIHIKSFEQWLEGNCLEVDAAFMEQGGLVSQIEEYKNFAEKKYKEYRSAVFSSLTGGLQS